MTHSLDWKRPINLGKCLTVGLLLWGTFTVPAIAAQVSPAPANRQAPPQAAEGDGYLLGGGDRVKLDFFNVPEFSGEYQVLPNGTINLPQVGAVVVQGRNLKQASQLIGNRYAAVLQRPVVTVSLLAARPINVAIAGEINRPGSYTIPAIAPNDGNTPNLTRIIQLAEGITQAADLRKVQVRRLRTSNTGAPNASETLTVDLWQLLQTGNVQQDLQLRDGDSIFIPPTNTVDLQEARQLAAANFAAKNTRPLKVSVVGEVARPGPYTLVEGSVAPQQQGQTNPNGLQVPSVTRAIQIAGGITQSADIRNVQIRRLTRSGPPQAIKLDIWKLLTAGDVLQDLPLQDGDTIEIPTAPALSDRDAGVLAAASFSPDKITVNIVGEVERPGAVSVPPNTPLNQALLTAGGFNKRASKRAVTFIRLNPNGSVSKRDINVDLAQGLNEQNNPPLRNNDTIVIRKSAIAGIGDALGLVTSPLGGLFGLLNIFGF
ncbi:MAG: SLBB domain-containing protein [Leptolyngbya sp. BL-A-14]